MMKTISKILTLAGLAAGFAALASADTIWNLDATFSYNSVSNTAMGTFELDPSLNLVTYDITVAGTNALADNEYTPGDSFPIFPDLTHLDFYDVTTNQYINLLFQTPLSNAGGTINLLYGDGGATNNSTVVCAGCGTLVSGTVSTAATPEPTSIGLVSAAGILGVALLRRKQVLNRLS
jgi:hypothetical protein